MSHIVILLVLILCYSSYGEEGKYLIAKSTTPALSYVEAAEVCKKINREFGEILSHEDQLEVQKIAKEGQGLRFGLHGNRMNYDFLWPVSKTKPTYYNWDVEQREPLFFSGEGCGYMLFDKADYKWHILPCSEISLQSYLCGTVIRSRREDSGQEKPESPLSGGSGTISWKYPLTLLILFHCASGN